MRTAFETLGVSVDATDAEIRAAWMAKIQQAHPDVAGAGYEAEAAAINAAYQAIRSAEARSAYRNSSSRQPSANSGGGTCKECGSSRLSDADLRYHTFLHAAEQNQNACQVCTREPAADVRYTGVTGFVLGRQHWEISARLCRDCGVGLFRAAQSRLLLTGWWSIFAFISTPFLLLANLARRTRHTSHLDSPNPREPGLREMLRGKPVLARPSVLALISVFVALNVWIAISASSDAYSSGSSRNSPIATATSPPVESTSPQTPLVPATTVEPWTTGSCVDLDPFTDLVAPITCSSPLADGYVLVVVTSPDRCPGQTDWYVEVDSLVSCVSEF